MTCSTVKYTYFLECRRHNTISIVNLFDRIWFSGNHIQWFYKTVKFCLSLFFSLVSHCFKGWSKINLKVYDAIHCLSKKLNNTVCLISCAGMTLKLCQFFRTKSLLMDKIIKYKRDLKLMNSCSSRYKADSEKFLY